MFIKELRQKKQLSQEMLAERCRLSLRTIQRVECGNRISYASMRALAAELDIDVEILELEINKMESTSNEYKDLPSWVRLFMGGGWLAANRAAYQRLEAFFIGVAVLMLGIWVSHLIWSFAPMLTPDVFPLGLLSMLIGAYSSSIAIRFGDKYDLWSRIEETMIQKGIFGIGEKKDSP